MITGSWVYADPDSDPDTLGLGLCVHEFGHNCGLNHNGSVKASNLKPLGDNAYHDLIRIRLDAQGPGAEGGELNLLSSMNYRYGGGLTGVGGVTKFDYARAYEVVDPQDPSQTILVLLNELHASSGFPEANTLWSYPDRIPDELLYKAEIDCTDGTKKYVFPHRAGTGPLTAVQRRMDLNCNGILQTIVVNDPIAVTDPDGARTPIDDHTSFDEWRSLLLDFQRDDALNTFGTPSYKAEVSSGPVQTLSVQEPVAELLGGCATPTIPRGTNTTYRTSVVLFGSDTFHAAAIPMVTLAGAPAVYSDIIDWNADNVDDLWLEFRPADMTTLNTNATEVHLYGERANGRTVAGTYAAIRVSSPADTDGDGIHDSCDACPSVPTGGGARLPDGCPQ